MARYRKKPAVIEAVRWWGKYTEGDEWPDWFRDAVDSLNITIRNKYERPLVLLVHTLEGVMTATSGDYTIKGVNGEIYPCKPDIFESTYEWVDNDD